MSFSEKPSGKPDPQASDREGLPPPQVVLPPSNPPRSALITIVAASIVAALVACVVTLGFQAYQGNLIRANTLTQQGKVTVSGDEPVQVFYPVTYTSPPNLTLINNPMGYVVIVEQKPDHFKVRKATNLPSVEVGWKAEGIPQK